MQTRTKLMLLELIGGLFGWAWLIASAAALWFLVAALAFDGAWSSFFWAIGTAVLTKWLSGGFLENQRRVSAESSLANAQGLIQRYAALLESGDLIWSEQRLPATKAEIKVALVIAAQVAKLSGESIGRWNGFVVPKCWHQSLRL